MIENILEKLDALLKCALDAEAERLLQQAQKMQPLATWQTPDEPTCVEGSITPIIDDPTRLLA